MKKFIYIIIIFSISFYLSIEFIGDRLIKNKLEENISNALNREVSIDKLNIKYLSGEADIFGIRLLNKNFEGELARIDTVKLNLDTLSLYSNNIIINNVLVENIKLNYYFNFTDQIVSDNVRSLEKDLKNTIRERIGPVATPDYIHITEGLPKTRSGKIMRRILRKIASNDFENLGDTSTLADPSVVNDLIENRKNK